MADIKERAREYLAEHSEYSEVFGETFVAVDTLTAMVDFAEQENAELKKLCNVLDKSLITSTKNNIERQKIIDRYKGKLTKAKELLKQLVNIEYAVNIPKDKIRSLRVKAEQFLKESE